jgi:hypothetical protein
MVDSVAATLALIVANGGKTVQPIGADAPGDRRKIPQPRRKRDRPVPGPRKRERVLGRLHLIGDLFEKFEKNLRKFESLCLRAPHSRRRMKMISPTLAA